jgi:hypothetical protein
MSLRDGKEEGKEKAQGLSCQKGRYEPARWKREKKGKAQP